MVLLQLCFQVMCLTLFKDMKRVVTNSVSSYIHQLPEIYNHVQPHSQLICTLAMFMNSCSGLNLHKAVIYMIF